MTKTNLRRDTGWKRYRPLIATALAVGGTLHMVGAVLADGTAARQSISNTATATYEDENSNTINATSNTVTVTVGEVPGLTVVPAGIDDLDGGSVEAGDEVHFDFDVTNVGNYNTDIFVPDIDNLTPTNFIPTEIEIFDSAGNSLGVIANDGGDVGKLLFQDLAMDLNPTNIADVGDPDPNAASKLAPGEKITIKVKGTVPTSGITAGQPVGVRIGDTGPNDNSALSQNQDDANPPEGVGADDPQTDIRTVDTFTNTPTDSPAEREASATQEVPFAASVRPLALATVMKTAVGLDNKLDTNPQNDEITYELSLSVEDTDPTGQYQPAPLEGAPINIVGTGLVPRILVSDAIPADTELTGVNLSLPTGWEVVYTLDDPATVAATDADWTPGPLPSDPTGVKRIGFIYDGSLAQGVTVNGLQFTVTVTDTAANYTIENLAQVFGQTVGDPNPTPDIIYDESGDANPNNFPDGATFGTPVDPDGGYDDTADFGIAPESDPDGDGNVNTPGDFDTNNDNTGVGADGEANVVTAGDAITPPADVTGLLNGPDGQPGAVYNTINDDFTNLSAADVPAGLPPSDGNPATTTDEFDPAPVLYTNTLDNSNSSGFIATVGLQPIAPALAASLDPSGTFGANADIPVGTDVTIIYDDGVNLRTATYEFNGTAFTLTRSTTNPTGTPAPTDATELAALTADGAASPINVGDIYGADTPFDYQVLVDSEDTTQLDSIPVPILAFSDDDPVNNAGYNIGTSPELTTNITVDRLYTGFMELIKEVRITDAAGNQRQDWTDSPTVDVVPGDAVDYRISYRNITEEPSGTGNVGLNARNFTIVEDGYSTVSGTANNWAKFTSHENGYIQFSGNIEYFNNADGVAPGAANSIGVSDPATGTVVNSYINAVGIVFPGRDGFFQFRRVVD
ncbi:MAG: hypothetical protein QNJ46_09470 [Leptolyngbyaceae cyanobacterium MO_188.B28]|nr:hypothetical protein [Leptolyngbyaceae cyanobacterium MO_188.B28]